MTFFTGLGNALQALDCFVLSSADYLYGASGQLAGLDAGLSGRVISGLRRLRGCDPANDPPPPEPLFEGGQCQGVQYRIFFTRNNTQTGVRQPEEQAGFRNGPLTVTQVSPAPTTCGDGVASPEVYIHSANDTPTSGLPLNNSGAGACTNFPFNTSIRVERADGLSDDCGDPPPVFPPPSNINIDVDVEFTDEGDNIVNVTVPITIRPFTVNFNGDIKFPFDFDLGGIEFNGDFSFDPEFNFNVGGPTLPPGPIDIEPGDPDPTPPVPPAPRDNKVQGVLVTATVAPNVETSSYNNGGIPDIYVPRLGSVKFAYSFGARTVWSNDIDVKGTNVFIPCPFSQGADAVAGSPVEGVTFALAALTGPPLATVVDVRS